MGFDYTTAIISFDCEHYLIRALLLNNGNDNTIYPLNRVERNNLALVVNGLSTKLLSQSGTLFVSHLRCLLLSGSLLLFSYTILSLSSSDCGFLLFCELLVLSMCSSTSASRSGITSVQYFEDFILLFLTCGL